MGWGESERARLRTILVTRSVRMGKVVLASGRVGKFYVDVKQTVLTPEGFALIGAGLYPMIRETGAAYVGGLAVGAVPLVGSVLAAALSDPTYPVFGFFVRPAAKEHGLGRKIEGCFDPRQPVAILEDVVTTGQSALLAIESVRAAGGRAPHVIAVVDREEGAQERLAAAGCTLASLFTRSDLIVSLT